MFKLIIALTYASLFFSGSILGNTQFSYIGVDILYGHVDFKDGYGNGIFTENTSKQLNLFVGYFFNKFVGLECGYEQNINKSNIITVAPMINQFGAKNFTAMVYNVYDAKYFMNGVNLNTVFLLRLSNSFAIVPVLGLVYIRTRNTLDLRLFDGDPATSEEKNNYYISFLESKIIPKLGVRLQYAINKVIGVRASYIWEKTDMLAPSSTRRINPTQILQTKFNNTSSVGIGMFAQL